MFKMPNNRLAASTSALLASESFLAPLNLRAESKNSQAALESLRRGFEELKNFVPTLATTAPGVRLVEFDAQVPPRVARIDVVFRGKEHQFDLTLALKIPIPKEMDFWARVQFITAVYDRLSVFVASFEDRKDLFLYLDEARLDQQKEDPAGVRA